MSVQLARAESPRIFAPCNAIFAQALTGAPVVSFAPSLEGDDIAQELRRGLARHPAPEKPSPLVYSNGKFNLRLLETLVIQAAQMAGRDVEARMSARIVGSARYYGEPTDLDILVDFDRLAPRSTEVFVAYLNSLQHLLLRHGADLRVPEDSYFLPRIVLLKGDPSVHLMLDIYTSREPQTVSESVLTQLQMDVADKHREDEKGWKTGLAALYWIGDIKSHAGMLADVKSRGPEAALKHWKEEVEQHRSHVKNPVYRDQNLKRIQHRLGQSA